jgi:predicted phage terminase large subunit-like protein
MTGAAQTDSAVCLDVPYWRRRTRLMPPRTPITGPMCAAMNYPPNCSDARTAARELPRRKHGSNGQCGEGDHRRATKLLAGFDYGGSPSTGEKHTRWRPLAAQAEAGNVVVVHGAWTTAWLDELAVAPVGAHDDQVDSAAGAFAELALEPVNTVTPRRLTGF